MQSKDLTFEITFKDYLSFLNNNTDILFNLSKKIIHSLSYQRYCYDLLLHNYIDENTYKKDINLIKVIHNKKNNKIENETQLFTRKKQKIINNEKWWLYGSPEKMNAFWNYYFDNDSDLAFSEISINFIKALLGIIIIKENKELNNDIYVEIVKMINLSIENWIIEWRDITMDFNYIIRQTYKLLPNKFLKIY